MTKQHLMINTPVSGLLWKMTLPLIPAMILLLTYDVLETYVISSSGTETLAVLAFSAPITTGMLAIAIAISICTNNWICHTLSNDISKAQFNSITAIIFGAGIAIVATLLLLGTCHQLFIWLGVNYAALPESFHMGPKPNLEPLVNEYAGLRLLGWVFLILNWQINGILRSAGLIKRASALLALWMVCKIVGLFYIGSLSQNDSLTVLKGLAELHIFVDGGFTLISLICLCHSLQIKQLPTFEHILQQIRAPFNNSHITITLQQSLMPISIGLLTALISKFSAADVALLGIVFRIEMLALLLPMAFTASLPGIIASNWWSGQVVRVKKIIQQAFISICLMQLLIAVPLFLFSSEIVTWFTADPYMQNNFREYLTWVPISFVGVGCTMVAISCFNAIGWTNDATVIGIIHRILLTIAFATVGAEIANIAGIFAGIAIANFASLISVASFARSHRFELKAQNAGIKLAPTKSA